MISHLVFVHFSLQIVLSCLGLNIVNILCKSGQLVCTHIQYIYITLLHVWIDQVTTGNMAVF